MLAELGMRVYCLALGGTNLTSSLVPLLGWTPHLIQTIGALEERGVGFRSLTEAIDTTTSGGRLIFHVFGALGQFERDLIRDRTKAGLTAAAARGRQGGRKPVVTFDKLQRAREHIANGLNVREAATRVKVSKSALYTALQSASADDPK
jgi:DNA invertase Pin-like site-specific DNA recombinase